ncbi:MAG: type IX secretion system membrane protein PorP/SprF [Mangrovibacterium sp.]
MKNTIRKFRTILLQPSASKASPLGGGWRGLLFLCFALGTSHFARAQQDPLYTQYMFNIQLVNPAYVGTWDGIGVTALTRNQWLGVDKAPTTNTLSFQAPMKNDNMAFGASVMDDRFGNINRLAVYADYSYMLQLNDRGTKLRLGLKAGFSNYFNDLGAHKVQDVDDPAFQGLIEQSFMPNFGFGVFLYDDLYYFGASIPKMIEHNVENDTNKDWNIQSDLRHWTFMGGYVFTLTDEFKFKPSTAVRMVAGAPLNVDFNANFLIKEKFWFGGMYRLDAGFGANLQFIIDEKLRVGYSIDFSNKGIYANSMGVHELMVSYELNVTKNIYRSPRYY